MKPSSISKSKRAEEALRENEANLTALVENTQDRIWAVDADYRLIVRNSQFLQGVREELKREIALGESVLLDSLPQAVRDEWRSYYDRALRGESFSVEKETQFYQGPACKDYRFHPIRSAAGKIRGVVVSGRDITERKRAEEALREAKEFSESLIASARDGISVLDNRGVHIDVNPALCEMTGFLREELIGVGPPHPYWPPELYEEIDRSFRKTRAGDFTDVELTFMRKNGERFPVIVNPAWIKDQQGNVISYFATVKDITERKRTEEEIRRKAKELEEKNDELTRFTHAVSHDLRSPLVTIQTFQGYLERDIRSQDAARVEKDLGYIRNAADKMDRLLDDLRRLSRIGRMTNPSEEAPLQAIVKEALDLAAGRITGRGVRIDLMEEPVVLYGDRTRLVEVFLNLVENAVKFMGDEPAPRIEIGVEQAGEELVLHVRDNGIGIDPELQPLVFGMFHKLDPETEGEGIGLALVRRIVEMHGGRIWVESEGLGKGATFRFTLAKTRRRRAEEEKL